MKDWLRKRDKEILSPYYNLIDSSIDDFISKSDRKPVLLEVGCGRGTKDLLKIYNKCEEVIGVDPNKASLQENKYVTREINSSLESVNLPKNSVDIVISAWVFEHIESPIEGVSEIEFMLRKGGYLVFITPNKNSLPSFISRLTPHFLQAFLCRILYRRDEKDTYPTFYRLNSIKDLKKYFVNFKEKDMIMHDNIKFFGSFWLFRPLAIFWNCIIMSRFMKNFRSIIISRYIKR